VRLHRAGRGAAAAAGVAKVEVLHRGPLHGGRAPDLVCSGVRSAQLGPWLRVVPPFCLTGGTVPTWKMNIKYGSFYLNIQTQQLWYTLLQYYGINCNHKPSSVKFIF
jgi:hypothetical protein